MLLRGAVLSWPFSHWLVKKKMSCFGNLVSIEAISRLIRKFPVCFIAYWKYFLKCLSLKNQCVISARLVSPNGIAKVMFAKHSPHKPLCRQAAVLGWTRSSKKQLHCDSTTKPQYCHGLGKSTFQWFTHWTVVFVSSIANRMTLFRNLPIDVKISACVGEEKSRVKSVSPRNVAIFKQNLQENQKDILEMCRCTVYRH